MTAEEHGNFIITVVHSFCWPIFLLYIRECCSIVTYMVIFQLRWTSLIVKTIFTIGHLAQTNHHRLVSTSVNIELGCYNVVEYSCMFLNLKFLPVVFFMQLHILQPSSIYLYLFS